MSDKQTLTVTFTNEGDSMGTDITFDPPLSESNQQTDEQKIMQSIAKGSACKIVEFLKTLD